MRKLIIACVYVLATMTVAHANNQPILTTSTTTNLDSLFLPLAGALGSTTEGQVLQVTPTTGTLSKLYCLIITAPGVGKTRTFTVRDNSSDSALTCTISGNASTTCNDTTHTASITAGDWVDIGATQTASTTSSGGSCGVVFTPGSGTKTIYSGSNFTVFGGTADRFPVFYTAEFNGSADDSTGIAVAVGGTAQNYTCKADAAPGVGVTLTLTLGVNAAASALTCTISGNSATSCTDVTHTVTLAAGDRLLNRFARSGASSTTHISCGFELAP